MNEWKMVPVEPSDKMVDAVMRHAGWHIKPEEAVTVDGVKVGGISEQEAVSLNAEIAKGYRREWAAWLAASPPAPVPAVPPGDVLAKIATAEAVVNALCDGSQRWTMSVPARVDSDPDLVISDALMAAREALSAPAPAAVGDGRGSLDWAVQGWRDEVQYRPLVNVHRRFLDAMWRQMIRRAGGDPLELVGPDHDMLRGFAPMATHKASPGPDPADAALSRPAPADASPAGDREARRFFSFSQDEDFEEHDTAEAAEHAAQESIDFYRDLAPDGWPEAVEYVRWGVVLGMAVQKPKDKGLVDYELQRLPALAQPAAPVAQERSHRAEVSDDWMRCESRRPWILNSLRSRVSEMRNTEKRCRGAFRKDYMGEPARYFADAIAEAASVLEARIEAINRQRGQG